MCYLGVFNFACVDCKRGEGQGEEEERRRRRKRGRTTELTQYQLRNYNVGKLPKCVTNIFQVGFEVLAVVAILQMVVVFTRL